jgi:hypothetical protein
MLDGVLNIIGSPADPNAYTLRPPANVAYANTFRYDTAADMQVLLSELDSMSSGNFFWFGHGNGDAIAGNVKKSNLGTGDVENRLNNKAHRSTPKNPRKNKHPYRFVVLNGCETYSEDWAHAFGVDFAPNGSQTITTSYVLAGRMPRAFVGWKKQIDVPNRFGSFIGYETEYSEGLAYLFFNWMQGNFLNYSLGQYASRMAFHGFDDHDSWRISGCANLTRFD